MTELAFTSKHPHVPPNNRWIASLSDGRTVFQDNTPHADSSWSRLKRLIESSDLQITNLRLEAYGQRVVGVPLRHPETGDLQVDGYWHANKIAHLAHPTRGVEVRFVGIGYIIDDRIYITWVREDGHIINEMRDLYRTSKSGEKTIDMGAILR